MPADCRFASKFEFHSDRGESFEEIRQEKVQSGRGNSVKKTQTSRITSVLGVATKGPPFAEFQAGQFIHRFVHLIFPGFAVEPAAAASPSIDPGLL